MGSQGTVEAMAPPPSGPRYYVHLGLLGTQMVNALYGVLTERMLGRGGAGTHPLVFSFWRDVLAWPILQAAAYLLHGDVQQSPEQRDVPRITVQVHAHPRRAAPALESHKCVCSPGAYHREGGEKLPLGELARKCLPCEVLGVGAPRARRAAP